MPLHLQLLPVFGALCLPRFLGFSSGISMVAATIIITVVTLGLVLGLPWFGASRTPRKRLASQRKAAPASCGTRA